MCVCVCVWHRHLSFHKLKRLPWDVFPFLIMNTKICYYHRIRTQCVRLHISIAYGLFVYNGTLYVYSILAAYERDSTFLKHTLKTSTTITTSIRNSLWQQRGDCRKKKTKICCVRVSLHWTHNIHFVCSIVNNPYFANGCVSWILSWW